MPLTLSCLMGLEVETVPDYKGQPCLGVMFHEKFHPIPNAYNVFIARGVQNPQLCMTPDANRSYDVIGYPQRTSIEFRSGPEESMNQEVLNLIQCFSNWLIEKKEKLADENKSVQLKSKRSADRKHYYLNLSEFIVYYNTLYPKQALSMMVPESLLGGDFQYVFGEDAEWVLEIPHTGLSSKNKPIIFTTQANLCIPIGCVFSPETRERFPRNKKDYPYEELEYAADFNPGNSHPEFDAYEEDVYANALDLADEFFDTNQFPKCALGAKDFFRGMVYEIAMISTSYESLEQLFLEEAKKIALKRRGASPRKNKVDWDLLGNKNEITFIAHAIALSLKKDIFPYMLKTTLAEFFKNLHPYEQKLIQKLSKGVIETLCRSAVQLSNEGRSEKSAFFRGKNSYFMAVFNDFYTRTILQIKNTEDNSYADPLEFLFERFIGVTNIGSEKLPVPGVVIEVRRPVQMQHQAQDVTNLYKKYRGNLCSLLEQCAHEVPAWRIELDAYQKGTHPAPKRAIKTQSTLNFWRKSSDEKQAEVDFSIKGVSTVDKVYQQSDMALKKEQYSKKEDKLAPRASKKRGQREDVPGFVSKRPHHELVPAVELKTEVGETRPFRANRAGVKMSSAPVVKNQRYKLRSEEKAVIKENQTSLKKERDKSSDSISKSTRLSLFKQKEEALGHQEKKRPLRRGPPRHIR